MDMYMASQTKWLTSWFFYRHNSLLADFVTYLLNYFLAYWLGYRLRDLLTDNLTYLLTYKLTDLLPNFSISRPNDWLIHRHTLQTYWLTWRRTDFLYVELKSRIMKIRYAAVWPQSDQINPTWHLEMNLVGSIVHACCILINLAVYWGCPLLP